MKVNYLKFSASEFGNRFLVTRFDLEQAEVDPGQTFKGWSAPASRAGNPSDGG